MRIDAACWAMSERRQIPSNDASRLLGAWRSAAVAAARDAGADEALPFGTQAARLDHLFVGATQELAPAGSTPPAAQALAMRLATLAPTDPSLPLYGLDGCSVVLHVLHGWGGGAQRFVEDLARADRERHHLVLLARSDSALRQHGTALALHADLHSPALRQWPLSAPIAATALHSDEYAAHLATVVRDFGVGALLVSSLIGHSLDALRSGLPTAVVCHDYYPLWPRLHADFGDAKRDYSAAGIDAALAQPGPDFEFSDLRPQAWRALRAAYVQALQRADATLLAPSACVQDNLCRIEPALAQRAWRRIEHGFCSLARAPARDCTGTRTYHAAHRGAGPPARRQGRGPDRGAAAAPARGRGTGAGRRRRGGDAFFSASAACTCCSISGARPCRRCWPC
jgi:hypothetical protein